MIKEIIRMTKSDRFTKNQKTDLIASTLQRYCYRLPLVGIRLGNTIMDIREKHTIPAL